jgi:tRNA modification GTPase
MREPATYTREDVVEINCHGGMAPLWRIVSILIAAGARQAEPGEFTKRAFLNGRIDLVQAEAVMDIIHAKTELSHQAANELLLGGLSAEVTALRDRLVSLIAAVEAGIDFPEDEIETHVPISGEIESTQQKVSDLLDSYTYGRILRDGFAAAIVGRPNVGKSSLLNALLKHDRAIVTEIPGTTRDIIEEYLNIAGVPIRILDTAGIRHSLDQVEQEGVRRSLAAIASADIVLVVLDGSQPLTAEDRRVLDQVKEKTSIAIINKADLPRAMEELTFPEMQVTLSCRSGAGLENLRHMLSGMIRQGCMTTRVHPWAINQRHQTALMQAKESLDRALASVRSGLSPEFTAMDLRGALDGLGLIIGATYTEDILERIFSEFCIGK